MDRMGNVVSEDQGKKSADVGQRRRLELPDRMAPEAQRGKPANITSYLNEPVALSAAARKMMGLSEFEEQSDG